MSIKDFTFIDLFAGIGGFRIALESFGAKCVFSSEKDKHVKNITLLQHLFLKVLCFTQFRLCRNY